MARPKRSELLTAPGIPQIFMGQEFLEDKPWDVDPRGPNLLSWNGLDTPQDSTMRDHLRFTKDLIRLRRYLPALRSDNDHAFYQSHSHMVISYHRWRDGSGDDVIVVASFAETTWTGYRIGFPSPGFWKERFNSDVYDHWVNPQVAGNGGGVVAEGRGLHGFSASAEVVVPPDGCEGFV